MDLNEPQPYYADPINGLSQFFIHQYSERYCDDSLFLHFNNEQARPRQQPTADMFYQELYFQDEQSGRLPKNGGGSSQDGPIPIKEQVSCQESYKTRKSKKNQYDKNIFANITTVVIKKMLVVQSHPQLKLYCEYKQIPFKAFLSYFKELQRSKLRLGTTELAKFYSNSSIPSALKEVFSMFLVRFLKEEYILYILREGKMNKKQKYLKCATKMMYVAELSHPDYHFLNSHQSQQQ